MSDEVLVSRAALQRVVTLLEQLPQLPVVNKGSTTYYKKTQSWKTLKAEGSALKALEDAQDPLLLVDLDDALRSNKADSLREQIRDLEDEVRRLREGW